MPMNWPDTLPQQMNKDGDQDAFADNRMATPPDMGPALVRTRFTSMPRRVVGTMLMTKTQLNQLRAFWKYTTLEGKLPFYFPDPMFGTGWRRNWYPNNTYAGAVVGEGTDPGTPPNHWTGLGTQNGIFKQLIEKGVEGYQYVDIRFSGTGTGNGIAEVVFCASTDIPSASGEEWTHSAYVRMIAGSKTNITNILLIMYNVPTTIAHSTNILDDIGTGSLTSQRYQHTWTPEASGMSGIWGRIRVTAKVGIFSDITLRIAGVQLEKYNKATGLMYTPNTYNPLTRFAAGGRPPMPVFVGGNSYAVTLDLEIFEV